MDNVEINRAESRFGTLLGQARRCITRIAQSYRALRLRWTLEDLGPVPMRHRLTGIAILCGDCGPSEMTRSHACSGCGGTSFVLAAPRAVRGGGREWTGNPLLSAVPAPVAATVKH